MYKLYIGMSLQITNKMNWRSQVRRAWKVRKGLVNLVEDHHVIPRQFCEHPIVKRLDLNLDSGKNLILMPTMEGFSKMALRKNRLLHTGGHVQYNKHVEFILDTLIPIKCPKLLHEVYWGVHDYLKYACRQNTGIPWK